MVPQSAIGSNDVSMRKPSKEILVQAVRRSRTTANAHSADCYSLFGLLAGATTILAQASTRGGRYSAKNRRSEKARELSHEYLAAAAGVHRAYVGMIRLGEKNVTIYNIERNAQSPPKETPGISRLLTTPNGASASL